MTKQEIRNYMIERINETLESEIEENPIENCITVDHINDFLWEKDFGMDIVEAWLDNRREEQIQELLQEIYNSIDEDDLDSPF